MARNLRRRSFLTGLLLCVVLVVLVATACQAVGRVEKSVQGGDPAQGVRAIQAYGCGSCHMIDGVPGADSLVGPPLNNFEQRHYIAGNLPNTADNLILWIRAPQSIEPGTAMPDLDVSETDARHIVAYLYSR